jgi:hypothetical protein
LLLIPVAACSDDHDSVTVQLNKRSRAHVVQPTAHISTSTSYDPDEAQRMRIRALDAQGLSRNSIAAIVFGHKNKAVMDYIRAALEETA